MGLEISKHYVSYNFYPISVKLYEDIACHGVIETITFLAICQVLKNLWHFEF